VFVCLLVCLFAYLLVSIEIIRRLEKKKKKQRKKPMHSFVSVLTYRKGWHLETHSPLSRKGIDVPSKQLVQSKKEGPLHSLHNIEQARSK